MSLWQNAAFEKLSVIHFDSVEEVVHHLNNVPLWSIDNPAEDTVIIVELWVIWTMYGSVILN